MTKSQCFRGLTQEPKGGRVESANIRKDRGKVYVRDPKPGGESGAILIYGSGWYPTASRPASLIRIVWAVRRESGKNRTIGAGHTVELPP